MRNKAIILHFNINAGSSHIDGPAFFIFYKIVINKYGIISKSQFYVKINRLFLLIIKIMCNFVQTLNNKSLEYYQIMKKTLRIVYTLAFLATTLVANASVEIVFTPTKTTWATLGSSTGETVGTVEVTGMTEFDHIEAEMRCAEDPDQYITFINMYTTGGNLRCATGEGWQHNLYNGYHYTMTIKAFDVPYYGVQPVKTLEYKVVGTGITAPVFIDVNVTNVSLQRNSLYLNGYNMNGPSFDITFSQPLSEVEAWWAMGMDGSMALTASKKSNDGKTWTIMLPPGASSEEGSLNIQVTGWDANGTQIRGEGGEHSFAFNIVVNGTPTGINNMTDNANAYSSKAFNLCGQSVSKTTKGIVIVNGKKILNK